MSLGASRVDRVRSISSRMMALAWIEPWRVLLPRTSRSERGDTLVEILFAIVILSGGVLGIYATLGSSIVAADGVKGRATSSQIVTRVADAVQIADWECAEKPTDSYRVALQDLKPSRSWKIEVVSMSHWGRSRTFEEGCPAVDDDPLFKMLKMTIHVNAPGGRSQQSVELLKRP